MKYSSRSLITIALSFLLVACTPTATSRATGEVIDDAALTARVKTELADTRGLGDALAINVDSYRGVVSLAGFVNSEHEAQMAVNAARKVDGVREVRNNLQVKPKQQ